MQALIAARGERFCCRAWARRSRAMARASASTATRDRRHHRLGTFVGGAERGVLHRKRLPAGLGQARGVRCVQQAKMGSRGAPPQPGEPTAAGSGSPRGPGGPRRCSRAAARARVEHRPLMPRGSPTSNRCTMDPILALRETAAARSPNERSWHVGCNAVRTMRAREGQQG